jgi:peptidoglycan/xylan/chitin deacetylase (PgdA/CDA1 family)
MSAGKIIKHRLAAVFPGLVLIRQRHARRHIAITFDDGPDPRNTPRILDILEANGASATFFVQGKTAEEHPSLVREMAARGHQIGNHGYSHMDARNTNLRAYVEDTLHAQNALENILGRRIEKIFRPPYGNITGPSFLALTWRGFRFVFWSVDSRDSFIRETPALTAYIDSLPIAGGDILLLHDDYAHTVESLPRILQSLKDRSLEFSRISDLGKHNEI